jgi:hypothetical protein
METILTGIQNNILEIINLILVGVFTYLGTRIKKLYEKYVDDKTKKEIVKSTVEYVEQVCSTLEVKKTSQEKFEQAKEKAIEWLNEKGISISDTEIEILIESAVNSFNKGLKGEK